MEAPVMTDQILIEIQGIVDLTENRAGPTIKRLERKFWLRIKLIPLNKPLK